MARLSVSTVAERGVTVNEVGLSCTMHPTVPEVFRAALACLRGAIARCWARGTIATMPRTVHNNRAVNVNRATAGDWCHLCGNREQDLAECHYPDPAHDGGSEHKPDGPRDQFLRVCATCADLIAYTARSG